MNLFGSTPQGTGYTAPILSGAPQAPALNQTQLFALRASDPTAAPVTDNDHWVVRTGKLLAAAPGDVIDSMMSLFPGIQRGSFDTGLYRMLGMPEAADYVDRNRQGVEAFSGVLGAVTLGVTTDVAITRAMESAWMASSASGRVGAFLSNYVPKAEAAARTAMLSAAARGETLNYLSSPELRTLLVRSTVAGASRGAAQEAVIGTLLHNNSAVWSDDMSQNILFAGLGIGLGAGLGAVGGRAMLARWANSPAVRDAYAGRFDPRKLEAMVAEIPGTYHPSTGVTSPKRSSIVTAEMLNARDAGAAGADNPIRVAIKDETGGSMAQQELAKITVKGNSGVQKSAFPMDTAPEGAHLRDTLHDDPTAILGADTLGKLPEGKTALEVKNERESLAQTMIHSKDPEMQDMGRYWAKQTPMFLVNKTWMSAEDADSLTSIPPNQTTFKPTSAGISEMTWEGTSGARYTINENGTLNFDLHQQGGADAVLAYEGANRVMKSMLSRNETLVVPKDAKPFQLDMAIEFERRGGNVDWKTAASLGSAEEALIKSLSLKSDALKGLQTISAEDRIKLNLPLANSVEKAKDPAGNSVRALANAAKQPNIAVNDLQNLRASIMRTAELTQDVKPINELTGDMFNFNRDSKGNWRAPVVGYFDAPDAAAWHKFNLADSIAEFKANQGRELISNPAAIQTGQLTQMIFQHPMLKAAADVTGLADSQLGGTRGVMSHMASQVLTQAQRFRHNVTLQAAQSIRRVVNRATEIHVDKVLTRLKPVIDSFSSTTGQPSRVLFNQYLSNTAGWDILTSRARADGMFEFVLDQTSANAQRLGRPVQRGEVLINPRTNKPIVLDQLAEGARKAFEKEFEQLRTEVNTTRLARGMSPIAHRPYYTPPRSTRGKIVGFTIDSAGRVVPGGGIVASSEREFNMARAELEANLPQGSKFWRVEDIQRHADLWDRAQIDFIDPTAVQANRGPQAGKLSSATIDPDAIGNAIQYLKKGYEGNANGVMRTVFQGQIGITEVRNAAFTRSGGVVDGVKNVYEQYQEALMGIPASRNPSGLNELALSADEHVDRMLAAVPTAWIQDVGDKLGVTLKIKRNTTFDELAQQLGPHLPYQSAVDYATQTYRAKPPPTMKGIARGLNHLGSALILRYFEIPHAAMNMAGIITNMPGLLNSRTVPIIGRVKGVPIIDQMKIMSRGFRRMLAEGDAGWQKMSQDWDMMVKNGDTSQDVAELHHQLSLIQSKSTFMKVMTGDQNAKSLVAKKGIEGMISILSDTSESMSRRWAHFVGLELADHHGIVGLEARHDFARAIANDAIANYDPLNRPELYSSGFGSMYGLFMSYAQNYYQRMFRYLEDGEYKSFGVAMAAQASMFGLTGLPGARQLADMIGNTSDGDGLVPRIYDRFGPAVGSVVAYGGFDQIVTLFGLPPVAFHTRGDVNFRSPALDMITSGQMVLPAGLEVVKDLATSAVSLVSDMLDKNVQISPQLVAETIARTMPNRALRGAITVLGAGGKESDAYGNMTESTKGWAESMYRMLGLRSQRQQSSMEAYYMNQQALSIDAAKMDAVRVATRAAIRGGNFDALPGIFQKYLDAGGKPWNYTAWIRTQLQTADNSRTANQLLRALRSQGNAGLARRIELLTAPY